MRGIIVIDEQGYVLDIDYEIEEFIRKVRVHLSEYAKNCPNHGLIQGTVEKVIKYSDGTLAAVICCPVCGAYLDTIYSYQL